MDWFTKLRSEFTDILSLDWRIDIEEYVASQGFITKMQATGTPLNMDFLANSDELMGYPVKGSSVDINMYSDINFQYHPLFKYGQLIYRVSIYYNNFSQTLFWRGFINLVDYTEPYDAVSYPVIISASDNLGQLKYILFKYKTVIQDDTYYNGHMTESDIILTILAKINITSFNEFINIYESGMADGVGDSPMTQLYLNTDNFRDMYCYDVLTEILNKYNAWIRQINGVITIYRPADLSQAIIYGRAFPGITPISTIPEQFINRLANPSALHQTDGGILMMQAPAKKVTTHQNFGYKDSWLDNHNFKSDTFTDLGGGAYSVDSWTKSGVSPQPVPISQALPGESEGVLLKKEQTQSLPVEYNIYLEQIIATFVYASISDVFEFSFDYMFYNNATYAINGTARITIFSPGIQHWLNDSSLDECTWGAVPDDIIIIKSSVPGATPWTTFRRRIVGLPKEGPYTVRIYGSTGAGSPSVDVGFKNIVFRSTADDVSIKISKPSKFAIFWLGKFEANLREYQKNPPRAILQDNEEIVTESYIAYNDIIGLELNFASILGDVFSDGIESLLEAFTGAMAVWNYTLAQAARKFVTDHAADYVPGGVIVTPSGDDIIFTGAVKGVNFTEATTITNVSGTLNGTVFNIQPAVNPVAQVDRYDFTGTDSGTGVITLTGCDTKLMEYDISIAIMVDNFVTDFSAYYTAQGYSVEVGPGDTLQITADIAGNPFTAGYTDPIGTFTAVINNITPNVTGSVRIDKITLSGGIGVANILCDAVTKHVDYTLILTPTQQWHSRGQSEDLPLLKLMNDEIRDQYIRDRQLIQLPIMELDSGISQDQTDIRAVTDWTKYNCTLLLNGAYSRYTQTGVNPHILKTVNYKGWEYRIISIRYKVISGNPNTTLLFYTTPGHGVSGSYYKEVFFNIDGEWHTQVIDMNILTAGGSDYIDSIITALRFSFAGANVIIDFAWIGLFDGNIPRLNIMGNFQDGLNVKQNQIDVIGWVQKAPILAAEIIIFSLAVFNGKLYGGTNPNGKLYEWNGVNAWVQKAPKLANETRIYALAVFNGKLYGGTYPNGKLYEWNGVNAWVEKAPKLADETYIHSLAVFNGKLYGGTYPNSKLYEWNGVNAWVEKAPKLADESYIHALAVFNGKLYGSTSPNGKLYEWNGVNAWVQKAPKLANETYIFSLAVFNGKLYGGTNPNGKLYEWNGVNAWVQKAPKLADETIIYSLAVFNGKLYGGTYPNGKLYEWNGVNAWVQKAPQLADETYIYSLAVFNGKLYGGTRPNGNLYEWNISNRILIFNRGGFNVRDREWDIDIIEIM